MEITTTIPLLFGIFVTLFNFSILHYFGKGVCVACSPAKRHMISFGVGFTLVYFFAKLIPDLYSDSLKLFNDITITSYSILGGLILLLVLENYVYKHVAKNKLKEHEKAIHSLTLFAFNFIEGIILFSLFQSNFKEAILFLIVVLIIDSMDNFSLHFIHGGEKSIITFIVSSATFLGVLFAVFVSISPRVNLVLLSIIVGSLLYLMLSELIPKEKNRKIIYFFFGIIFFIILQELLGAYL